MSRAGVSNWEHLLDIHFLSQYSNNIQFDKEVILILIQRLFRKSTGDEVLDSYVKKYPGVDIELLKQLMEQEKHLTKVLNERRILLEKKAELENEWAEHVKENMFRHYLETVTCTPSGWYENMGEEYENTVYNKDRMEIESIVQGNLSELYLETMRKMTLKYNTDQKVNRRINPRMILHCDSVVKSKDGPCLILSDPCGYIKTAPVKNVPYDLACSWIGMVLVCSVSFDVCMFGHVEYNVSEIRRYARTLERK